MPFAFVFSIPAIIEVGGLITLSRVSRESLRRMAHNAILWFKGCNHLDHSKKMRLRAF